VHYQKFSAGEFCIIFLFLAFTGVYSFKISRKMYNSWRKINEAWWAKRQLKQEQNEKLRPKNKF